MEWNRSYEYTLRLDYNLNEESIVFDVGGYLGWFSNEINNKYKPKIYCFEPINEYFLSLKSRFANFENINIFNLAISDKNSKDVIYVNNDASSMYIKTGNEIEIYCNTLDKIMSDNNINHIDLMEINIEGEEYALLEYMITNNLVIKCTDIQIQFHEIGDDCKKRYDYIKSELEKTHRLTYHSPFVWENWEKIK